MQGLDYSCSGFGGDEITVTKVSRETVALLIIFKAMCSGVVLGVGVYTSVRQRGL